MTEPTISATTAGPDHGNGRRRRTIVPVATLLAVGLLAGCSGSSDSTTTATSSSATDAGPGDGGPGGGGGIGGDCAASSATPTAGPASAVPAVADQQTVADAVAATQAFLDTLDSTDGVVFDYADLDAKRCSWSNFPDGAFSGRQGALLGDLTDEQRTAAMAAVQSVMTAAGYTYVQEMMGGDDALAAAGGGGASFGSDNYHLALYGDPSTDTPWTLQFGGHHLVLHVSIGGDGTLSVSPYFKGAQPVSYEGDSGTVEPMAGVSEDFFGLFESMDEDTLALAELAGSYDDLLMGPGTDTGFPEAEGVAYTDLSADQQQLVQDVIADYVADYAPELSQPLLDLYTSQLDEVRVGWSASIDRDQPAYLRIDGPRVWIEWVNTGNPGESGIHYHTIYRDKLLDYGTGSE
jgi:hypothetical protein